MNAERDTRSISTEDLSRLHDLARRRAQELRREAIDDFWRGADAAWAATLDSARRSAQRLAHRLARREQRRSAHASAPNVHHGA